MKTFLKLIFSIVLFVLSIQSTIAQTTYSWVGGSGNWSVATNWSPNGVPTATDNVVITASGTYTVTLDGDSTINDLTIGGTSGIQTLSLSSRTFTINGTGTINDSGSVSLTSSTLAGTGTLTNTGTIAASYSTLDLDFDNDGFASFTGNCYINNALITQPNSIIRVQSAYSINTNLTIANGFTNNGLIEYTTSYYNRSGTLDITSGTLVNGAGGTILVTATGSNADNFHAPLDNQGTITLNKSWNINKADAAHTNNGTISINIGTLTLTQSGTTPSFTSNGILTVDSNGALAVNGGVFNYNSGTFTLNGTFSSTNATINLHSSFNTIINAFTLNNSTMNCTSSLTNQGDMSLTGSMLYGINNFINQGNLNLTTSTIDSFATLTNQDTLMASYGTLNVDFDNDGFASFTGNCYINNALITQPNSIIRVQSAYSINTNLTIANGFINNGLIEYTTSYYNRSGTLNVTSGTLVNAAGGTILVTATGSNADNFHAQLDNQGTITLNKSWNINNADAVHTNSGTISIHIGTLTLTQSGTSPTFTNTGIITVDSTTTLAIVGGVFNYTSGTFTLNGSFSATNATVNFPSSFNNIATAFILNNSTMNCTSSLTNQGDMSLTGSMLYGINNFINQGNLNLTTSTIDSFATLTNQDTLMASYSTFDLDFDNDGFASFTGNCYINNALITQPNSIIRVQSAYSINTNLTIANGFINNGLIEYTTSYYNRSGTLNVTSGTLVNAAGGTILVTATGSNADNFHAQLDNQGTITLNKSWNINNADAVHTNSGTISIHIGTLTLTQSGTSPSFTNTGIMTIDSATTLTMTGGTFNYSSGTFTLNGLLSATNVALNFTPSFINTSTINLSSSTLDCAANFTNENQLNLTSSTISGSSTFTNTDTMIANYSTFNLDIDNDGFASFTGNCYINNALITQPNSIIRVQSAYSINTNLTIANGFTNNGLIEYTTSYYNRSGTLNVISGTLVNGAGGTILVTATGSNADNFHAPLDNQGTIILNKSWNINKANESFFNSGEIQLNNATATFSGNQFENTMSGEIGGNGTLNVTGLIFVNNGSFIPGDYPGILNVQNDLPSAATAFLNFDLGGPIIGEFYNSLAVAQTANYNGTININLVDGFVPNVGQEFVLATCNTHTGSFLVQNGLSINAWKEFVLVYDSTELKLITSAISGQTSPYAYDDFATANDDVEIFVDVLYNDVDPNGENLSLVSVGPAKNGVTQVGLNNMVSYTPDSLFTGEDRFIYTIENTSGCRTSGMVTVTVNPVIPATPLLAYPADSTMDVSYDVTLGWFFSTEIDSYQVQISDVPTFNGGNEILVSSIVDTFVLVNLSPQSTYYWRVLSENAAGTSAWSVTWNFTTGNYTGVEDEIIDLPQEFALKQNYPNPFNPTTTIGYDLPVTTYVNIEIFNLLGQKIKTIIDGYKNAGRHQVIFDSKNLASGVYFYKIKAGAFVEIQKMTLLR